MQHVVVKMAARIILLRLAILLALITISSAACGYQSCNPTKSNRVNVHLVPHTHDDVGWLKTVDQYLYGANNSIQHAGVQYILDSVTAELAKDPGRRFIYVETAFFERWWHQQDEATQNQVKQFVNEGRLEFINGGWSMNDEACTHYNAIIDQMTEGLRFLVNTFGECGIPRVAWHIDPFGHSREQASLIAQMGFDGFFFARLGYNDKATRLASKTMEQIWHSNPSLGSPADLFFGALYAHYGPPPGFCYDRGCSDPPIQDDERLFDYNVDERVATFTKYAHEQATHFQTNHIIMTMGSDFQYENANAWYKNLDKLIKYVNAKEEETGLHLLYSTPSCYTYSLNQANKVWTTKSKDFMPYGDAPNNFWGGYFVSRPAIKGYVRESNKILQVCKQLESFVGMESFNDSRATSETLKEAMAVAQHHDAVTGTEKQHVANDYAKRLSMGRVNCQTLINEAIASTMKQRQGIQLSDTVDHCDYVNISICPITETQTTFTVVVYNPLARQVQSPIRVPVNAASYRVTGPDGTVTSQVQEVTAATKSVRRNRGNATRELVFIASLPPMGYTTYQVAAISNMRGVLSQLKAYEKNKVIKAKKVTSDEGNVSIENEFLELSFNQSTGLLVAMSDKVSNTSIKVNQSFFWYNASTGNNESLQTSGAYIFRPNKSDPFPLFNKSAQMKVVLDNQAVVSEIQQQFTPWLSQVIRLYKGLNYAEFQWTVGPIPFGDGLGKEIITRFDTDIQTDGQFYTDSNGRQMIHRILNHREDFKYNNSEPVAGNYYPINSRISIKDARAQMTILTDRSQGGSSLKDGSVEIMIHRRLLVDDDRGVGEPLNETGQFGDGLMVRGSHFVALSTPTKAPYLHRTLGEEIYMKPYFYVSSASMSPVSTSFITQALPENVHLLTLEQLTSDVVLLRLEHQFEAKEDATFSQSVTISLTDLFTPFRVSSVQELSLAANQVLKNVNRLQWNIEGSHTTTPQPFAYEPVVLPAFNVTLSPMDIRTFNVTITRH